MSYIRFKEIIRVTVQNWQNDRAPRLGAALAYYIALSLAPTLVILLAVSSSAFGASAAEGRLVSEIQGLVGNEGAKVIQALLKGAHRPPSGIAATVLGLVTLFLGTTAVVSELRDALNTIWKVREDTTCTRIADCERVDFRRGRVPERGCSAAARPDPDRRLGGLLCGPHGSVRFHF
jgi:uncharacterized BrkB/YihY/UPF0761 family membrane protein